MDTHDEDSNAPHGPGGRHGPDRTTGPGEPRETGGADEPHRGKGTDEPAGSLVTKETDRPHATREPSGPEGEPGAREPQHRPEPLVGARLGVAALSPRYQVGAALALAVVAVVACVHLGMVFLHVAPSNTVTKQHGKAIDDWIYPEFEQNWKLFAPNPLQQNIAVQVRAETHGADGSASTTGWYDLSAEDGRAIRGNPLPSHTQQNELRRAFDYYAGTHDKDNRPVGVRGTLSEEYLRRIVVLRLDRDHAAGSGGTLQRVQVRVRTAAVPPPRWSGETVPSEPAYRVLPWWTVPAAEARGGVR
ncbi:DUF5819 family protein [Streptomyces sp. MK7]|uniref:DUF5819 family protein n=1 Tax=Streptomyces sp. MK7 TaxID=3067635 RepID=UPI00292F123E|nr:DUF5819 family protein [Streptomyces sp. MK7]